MAVELIKEQLKIEQKYGHSQNQTMVEGEILISEDKPKLNSILSLDGIVKIEEQKVLKDKIVVGGIVKVRVLYSANEGELSIHNLEGTAKFNEEIEVEGITDKMASEVRAIIEHLDYSTVEGRKIDFRVVLQLEGKTYTRDNIEIIEDIKGIEGLQTLKEKIKYNNVVGEKKSSTVVKEAFEIEEGMSDVLEVLKLDGEVLEKEVKVVEDKVIIGGTLNINMMYLGTDSGKRLNYVFHEIPFTHFVEMSGVMKDMDYSANMDVESLVYDIKEDLDQKRRIVDVEGLLTVNTKVYNQIEKDIITDTYSTFKDLDIENEQLKIEEVLENKKIKEPIKSTIAIDEQENLVDIYDVKVKPILTDHRIIEDKIILEAVLDVNMLYKGEEEGDIQKVHRDVPIKTYIDLENITKDMESEINLALEGVHYTKKSEKEVEIESTLGIDVRASRIRDIDIVTNVDEEGKDIDLKSRPSITIYIVQEEDNLWDIAKRYHTTTEDLITTNDIKNPDNLMPGERIIIEKYIDGEII
ncbi:DUF3794 and LysM peptidoglycan-binding domain-containing protein [Clostridiisalibacter paucivorans]|uniref:DUF3794 and LysM peptidoglycan-binding domain-containing protein n=1 Tax=Clostridiisalibacter paucivorans TaxID=408753 RepID=UPI00047DAC16|nr:SPOCS domain-containing protein [Clostridiisalibacter paucivorans]